MNKLNDLMVDIETLGTKPGAVILSVAAVRFNIETGETGEIFNEKIDIGSCLDAGLVINADTLKWWMTQNEEARNKVFGVNQNPRDFISLENALTKFSYFATKIPNCDIWANSPRFDVGILENAFNKVGMTIPWRYSREMDVRTLSAIAPEIRSEIKFEGVQHDALDDCYHQIKYCTAIWKHINRERK